MCYPEKRNFSKSFAILKKNEIWYFRNFKTCNIFFKSPIHFLSIVYYIWVTRSIALKLCHNSIITRTDLLIWWKPNFRKCSFKRYFLPWRYAGIMKNTKRIWMGRPDRLKLKLQPQWIYVIYSFWQKFQENRLDQFFRKF